MCYLLFSPSGNLPKTGLVNIPHIDKIVHWGMFGILTLVYMYDAKKNQLSLQKTLWFLVVFSFLFGTASELIQYGFIAGRSGSFLDFVADISGVIMGIAFVLTFRWLIKKRAN